MTMAMASRWTANGNAYVTGYTTSTDFPVTTGPSSLPMAAADAFVAKLTRRARARLLHLSRWHGRRRGQRHRGGQRPAMPTSRATPTARTSPPPPVPSSYNGGGIRCLCDEAERDRHGARLLHLPRWHGDDRAMASRWTRVAMPTSRATPEHEFPVTAGAFQATYGGGSYDAFVAKFNASGTRSSTPPTSVARAIRATASRWTAGQCLRHGLTPTARTSPSPLALQHRSRRQL